MIIARLEKRQIQGLAGVWVLELMSGLDGENFQIASASESYLLLEKLVEVQVQELVIDLTAAKEFDSRGVQFLLMLHKQLAQHNIHIILRHSGAYLRRVLRIMQVDQIFEFEGVEEDDDEENSSS